MTEGRRLGQIKSTSLKRIVRITQLLQWSCCRRGLLKPWNRINVSSVAPFLMFQDLSTMA